MALGNKHAVFANPLVLGWFFLSWFSTSSTTWALQSNARFERNARSSSSLVDTQWDLKLDVGLQPGTWMPKRFPGWAESGARLGLGDIKVQFTNIPSKQGETLLGPLAETYQLDLVSPICTFVGRNGVQQVEFAPTGGWCIQRPTGNVRNAAGSTVKPEGLLRFWLDCKSGAKRQDVEIFPNTRIFCTTGVWDDPEGLKAQKEEYERVVQELDEIQEKTRQKKKEGKDQNVLEYLTTFGKMVGDAKRYDNLKDTYEALRRSIPPSNSPKQSSKGKGVLIAPNGSLVIKGNTTPDWMPGTEYLILGTFAVAAAAPS